MGFKGEQKQSRHTVDLIMSCINSELQLIFIRSIA
jgi:hypothetical protein